MERYILFFLPRHFFLRILCVILITHSGAFSQGQKVNFSAFPYEGVQGNILSPSTTSNCPNSNFSTGTYANWAGCWGKFLTPCMFPGFNTTGPKPRHHIIEAPGFYDEYTSWCIKESDSLISVFPGEAYSSRLGNSFVNDSAEELKYTVSVTSESYLFVYRYAIVLEDPGHAPSVQPSFTILIWSINL